MTAKKERLATPKQSGEVASDKLFTQEQLEATIAAELASKEKELKAKWQHELAESKIIERRASDRFQLEAYKTESMLVDEDFCFKLMRWGVSSRSASLLRDEHRELSRVKVWAHIRRNWSSLPPEIRK